MSIQKGPCYALVAPSQLFKHYALCSDGFYSTSFVVAALHCQSCTLVDQNKPLPLILETRLLVVQSTIYIAMGNNFDYYAADSQRLSTLWCKLSENSKKYLTQNTTNSLVSAFSSTQSLTGRICSPPHYVNLSTRP